MAQDDIIFKMGMDSSAFNRGLQQAKVQAKEFNGALNKFGATVGALGLAALTAKTVEYGSKIADLSARLGVSTDSLQEFAYAAQLSGGSIDDFATALQKLAVARQDALGDGGGEMAAAFAALGVSVEDLKNKRVEELFNQIGRGVRDAADVQNVLNDATTIFGKNSANVLAAMRNDLDAASAEARRLGLIIGEDVIKQLDELGDKADTLGKKLMAWFAPALTFLVEQLHDAVDAMRILGITAAGVGVVIKDIALGPRGAALASMAAAGEQIEQILAAGDARRAAAGRNRPGQVNLREAADNAGAIVNLQERKNALEREGLGITERKKALEMELKRLTAERVKPNIGEKRELEIDIKRLEVKKQMAALDERAAAFRQQLAGLRLERAEAVGEAESARAERTKFTLAELAGANLRGVSDSKLRADIIAAREVAQLESRAGFLRNRGRGGDLAEAGKLFSQADKVRAGIGSLTESERLPFKSMDEGIKRVDKGIAELVAKASKEGINVRPKLDK